MSAEAALSPVESDAETGQELAARWAAHLTATGRGNGPYARAARRFLARWPDPQAWADRPLHARLAEDRHTTPLLLWLMLQGRLRPGYDYLVARRLTNLWREADFSPLGAELTRFRVAAVELGLTVSTARATASQVPARLLIQTGRGLDELSEDDLDALTAALSARQDVTGSVLRHYRGALHMTRAVLFHLGVLDRPPEAPRAGRKGWAQRLAGPVVPHQLRHTYATAMVNAGVSLQALMALLGHVSANMSLRYGRLFDATVRANYERALTQAKAHLGGPILPPAEPSRLPLVGDWKDAPAIKARMAGGYCIRTPAQGSCAYANICEHCPNYRSDPTFLPILATQKADAEALAADAQARGWIDEADRHLRLVERLDAVISNTQAS